MSRIHLLKDALINKIAAGEVVERPASVVKELVENAIDAGADHVRVELSEGGKDLIVVTDNGHGIPPEDASLAVARHATSKIGEVDDLFAIDTMGFRGEALAAISSVSLFSIVSRQKGAELGVRVDVKDGDISTIDYNGREGTTITVKDLFYNLPVRKGFLKKASSEFASCYELIQAMALNLPEIGFTLIHNGKEHFKSHALDPFDHDYCKGEAGLRQRAQLVMGQPFAEKLLYLSDSGDHGQIEGLISPPGVDRGTSKFIFCYVNGRWVKDKTLKFAITRAYHSYLLKGKYPAVVLRLSLDPSLVDVNVHPSKTELRFQYPSEVQNLIVDGIRKQIRAGAWAEATSHQTSSSVAEESVASSPSNDSKLPKSVVENVDYLFSGGKSAPSRTINSPGRSLSFMRSSKPRDMSVKETRQSFDFDRTTTKTYTPPLVSAVDEIMPTKAELVDWLGLDFIGSYGNCYLMFDAGPKLLVVDQHAFHERIIYERLVSNPSSLGQQQPLLVPEELSLSAGDGAVLQDNQECLKSYGFELKFHSTGTIEVCGVPALLRKANLDSLFAEISSHLASGNPELQETDFGHKLLSTMACHSAVRAGEFLQREEVNSLLKEAVQVDFVLNCPHGRRVFKWWSKAEVEGWFDR